MSCPASSTRPSSGRSKPLRTLTSVDLPAPFGPISPTTSPRESSRSTPRSACTPSKARETEEARRVSPGLLSDSVGTAAVKSLDLDDDLGGDLADESRLVVLDADHAVLPPEDAVQRRREAHLPRKGRHALELLHDLRERHAVRRAVCPPDRGHDAVDRRGAGDEPPGARVHLLRERVH